MKNKLRIALPLLTSSAARVTLAAFFTLSANASTLFVQATKASMRAEPKATAAIVSELSRGDTVEGGEVQGFWTKITLGGKSGWMTKLSLGDKAPIGQNTLIDAGKLSDAKASRERVKSATVAASARGLSQEAALGRMRGTQIVYQPDNAAVSRMDTYKISDAALNKFISDAKLTP